MSFVTESSAHFSSRSTFSSLSFALAVLVEPFPVVLLGPCQIQLHIGFGFPSPVLANSNGVSVFLLAHLSLLPPLVRFLSCLHFLRSSLLIHAAPLLPFLDFQISWISFFSRNVSHGILRSIVICSPQVYICHLAFFLVLSSQDPELYHFMLAAGKAAFIHIPDKFFLARKHQVQQNAP